MKNPFRKHKRTQEQQQPASAKAPEGSPQSSEGAATTQAPPQEDALAEGAKGAALGGVLGGSMGAVWGGAMGLLGSGKRKKDSYW